MSEQINFDRAEYVEVSSLNCRLCREPLRSEYFDMAGATICGVCRDKIEAGRAAGAGPHRFLRAVGFGLGAAIIGAIIYALIVNFTGVQFGLMAVVLGYMVGRSVSVGSYHRGGRRYQILAMILTYAAICVEYVPQVMQAMHKSYSFLRIIAAFVLSLSIPFLLLFKAGISGLLGVFIVGIGLYEAWKLNKRGVRQIAGPFPIAPSASRTDLVAG
jgi:hypothetical protein